MVIKRIKKLIPSKESLLRDFILRHFENFSESRQQGNVSATRAGMSREKFFVAHLVGLTKHKTGDISEVMKIDYATLRRWKQDEAFLAVTDEVMNAFAENVSNYMRERVEKGIKTKLSSPPVPGEDFADAGLYNRSIIEKIATFYFKAYPGTSDLTALKTGMVFDYAEAVFGRAYFRVGRYWQKEYLIWLINRYILENTEILFSEENKIWVNREALDTVLGTIQEYLKLK